MKPLVIWRVIDRKSGHLAQSAGLVAALGRSRATRCEDIPARPLGRNMAELVVRGVRGDPTPEPPDLIVCCGHATHLTALALRHRFGGRVVVLMRPSLPNRLFDLVVAPEHDGLQATERVITTRGVLNPLDAEGPHHPEKGLILVGGPSRHHGWSNEGIVDQARRVTQDGPEVRWTLTTSRRTPASTVALLQTIHLPNLDLVPADQTPAGWVARQLADVGTAWVTEDSVSMIYEALTAGVAVGILAVPRRRNDRITASIDRLLADGWVTGLAHGETARVFQERQQLAEADRVAGLIIERWFSHADVA